jgi:hypothetical protein
MILGIFKKNGSISTIDSINYNEENLGKVPFTPQQSSIRESGDFDFLHNIERKNVNPARSQILSFIKF